MKLTVLGRSATPVLPSESYSLIIEVMHGDADHYQEHRIDGFLSRSVEDMELLQEHLETLQEMGGAYPHGRGGYDHYADKVARFGPIFGAEDLSEDFDARSSYVVTDAEERQSLISLYQWVQEFNERQGRESFVWPHDITIPDGREASVNSFKLLYIDPSGREHDVKIEL